MDNIRKCISPRRVTYSGVLALLAVIIPSAVLACFFSASGKAICKDGAPAIEWKIDNSSNKAMTITSLDRTIDGIKVGDTVPKHGSITGVEKFPAGASGSYRLTVWGSLPGQVPEKVTTSWVALTKCNTPTPTKTSTPTKTPRFGILSITANCNGSGVVSWTGTNPQIVLTLMDKHLGSSGPFIPAVPPVTYVIPAESTSPYSYQLDLSGWTGGPHYRVDSNFHTKSASYYCPVIPTETPTETPTPTLTPTLTETATETQEPPTETATPTLTDTPTETQEPPTETATPTETQTLEPRLTDTPTSTGTSVVVTEVGTPVCVNPPCIPRSDEDLPDGKFKIWKQYVERAFCWDETIGECSMGRPRLTGIGNNVAACIWFYGKLYCAEPVEGAKGPGDDGTEKWYKFVVQEGEFTDEWLKQMLWLVGGLNDADREKPFTLAEFYANEDDYRLTAPHEIEVNQCVRPILYTIGGKVCIELGQSRFEAAHFQVYHLWKVDVAKDGFKKAGRAMAIALEWSKTLVWDKDGNKTYPCQDPLPRPAFLDE
jgi:hypothetical protein